MKLIAKLRGNGTKQFEVFLNKYEKGFARGKKEGLRKFFKRVKKEAISNIELHSGETGYPGTGAYAINPGKLARSIDYDVNRGVIWAGNSETPYVLLHDKPMGEKTEIHASNSKYLVFFNHRTGEWNKKRSIMRPGIAFFTRAWTAALDDVDEIFGESIRKELVE